MGNYSKSWEDEDIDFRMTKESEEVLIKDRVTAPCGIKESGVEVSVSEEYCNSCSKDWEREK